MTNMPAASADCRTSAPTAMSKFNSSCAASSASSFSSSSTAIPINTKLACSITSTVPATSASHIPSYYPPHSQYATTTAQQLRLKTKEDSPNHLPATNSSALHHHQHSHLPQPVANYYQVQHQQHTKDHKASTAVAIDEGNIVSEMNKLYRKSPFLQRKYNNGSAANGGSSGNSYDTRSSFKYATVESPKKESVLSSIGQSIIRNLTTSPFSQKKHSHIPQPNQVDPLWRMPSTQDTTMAFENSDMLDGNRKVFGSAAPTDSPVLAARKRFQEELKLNTAFGPNPTTATATAVSPPLLLPLNRNETNPQRVQGNQSPIVLQRFYHQQNQLREKEKEKEMERHSPHAQLPSQQPAQYSKVSPQDSSSLAFGSGSSSNNYNTNFYHNTIGHELQLPLGSITPHAPPSSSSHSTTSSQSSTQSSSSQIAAFERIDQQQITPPAASSSASVSPLQYQPLPQQYMTLNNLRHSRSPPSSLSPEQNDKSLVDNAMVIVANNHGSKLSKFYAARRQLQPSLATASMASKENNFKDEHASANMTSTTPRHQLQQQLSAEYSNGNHHHQQHHSQQPSSLPYYRSNSTSNTSPPNSKSNDLGKSTAASTAPSNDFHIDGNTSGASFLRRFAGSSAATAGQQYHHHHHHTNAHVLAGLDRRHRSPDPPPRFNRGQSPLLLRKNLLELSGQPPGSPMLNRRYATASPPLPPPRRGSESVPGSPQHFRTRIHYTPEPQRRLYRTIDQ